MHSQDAEGPPIGKPALPQAGVRTVLYIEDNPVNMELVEGLIAHYPGIRLLKAVNGRDGVALAQAQTPDLVLLDMNLPDISGVDVVRALSVQISQFGLRIVLLTGESFSIDVVKAMSLGAREYWPKPLDVARLKAALPRLLNSTPPA